jgi:CRP/FNR family cyclic AMP-dependent transcriptional regulator
MKRIQAADKEYVMHQVPGTSETIMQHYPSLVLGQFLSQQVVEQALPASRRVFSKGDLLYGLGLPADEIFYLLEGRVMISLYSRHGSAVILDCREGGEIVGELTLLGIPRRKTEARAVYRTQALVVKTKRLLSAIQTHQYQQLLLQYMGLEVLQALELIETFALDQVEYRLAKRLLFSIQKARVACPLGGDTLDFSHEELAQMVGTSRQVVTQIMEKFRRAGLLEYARRHIKIKEEQILAFIQGCELPLITPGEGIKRRQ